MSRAKAMTTVGHLVVFEGPDGVGKTTVATEVAQRLNANALVCDLMTFPGKEPGTLGRLVYEVHHVPYQFGIKVLTPTSKQVLHVAAHLDIIERCIVPTLASGRHVLLDRFWWSTWVYGTIAGMDRHFLKRLIDLERIFWGRLQPSTVILIRRAYPINRPDRLKDWQRLAREYDRLAAKEARRHPVAVVENTGSVEQTIAEVLAICAGVVSTPNTCGEDSRLNGLHHKGGQETIERFETITVSNPPLEAVHTTTLAGAGPTLLTHLLPAKPTIVFNTYWRFAAERQKIFFARAAGKPAPWTEDPVLSTYKFTNAYRASDRVSQYLIRNVIYRDDLPDTDTEVFFRLLLFKLFNKLETWQLLERTFGEISFESYSFSSYDRILCQAMAEGSSIYSAAYIMPTGGRGSGETRKHRLHLRLLEMMMVDELPKKLADASSMHQAFDLLSAYPTIGDFLAYQFVTDINYSHILNFSEMDFVVPGPGALDGIRKCFDDRGGLCEAEIIKLMSESQEREFDRLGLEFHSLWGRPLQLIDCQNLFCEVDKYARVVHPEVSGLSGRTRIKQKFVCKQEPISYWYPPKWGINSKVPKSSD